MKILTIAFKDLKIVFKDYKALGLILAMPLILIFILGSALGPMFKPESGISPFSIAVVDYDKGEVAQRFIQLFESDSLGELINIQVVDTKQDALNMIEAGHIPAAVLIPEGLSQAGIKQSVSLEVLADPAQEFKANIISGIVDTFARQYSLIYAGTQTTLNILAKSNRIGVQNVARLSEDVAKEILKKTIKASELLDMQSQQGDWITAMQYNAVGMLLMFTLFGAMQGVDSIIREREDKTLARLFAVGVGKSEIIVSKTLAMFLICCVQMFILILFTRYAYRVDWGDSAIATLVFSLIVAFACTGFGMFIASICKSKNIADAVEPISVQVVSILGGCTFPIFMFPKVLQYVSRFTIPWWGLQGYLSLMQGAAILDVTEHIMVLLGMGVIFMILGIWRLRFE